MVTLTGWVHLLDVHCCFVHYPDVHYYVHFPDVNCLVHYLKSSPMIFQHQLLKLNNDVLGNKKVAINCNK